MMKISTVIITYNEEDKIERCIQTALAVSDEIIILDSFSTDQTVAKSKALGAKIYSQKFKGFIQQRKDSIALANYDLVLALDADEYLSPELIIDILAIKENPSADAYKLNRLSSISGYWMRNGSWHPDYLIRLFDKTKITNGGESPHDKIIPIKGAIIKKTKGVLFHDAYDSIQERIESIKKYSEIAAIAKFNKGIKSNSARLYIKTVWKFIVEYFFKFGILDGYYGWIGAATTTKYIYLRESKMIKLQKENKV